MGMEETAQVETTSGDTQASEATNLQESQTLPVAKPVEHPPMHDASQQVETTETSETTNPEESQTLPLDGIDEPPVEPKSLDSAFAEVAADSTPPASPLAVFRHCICAFKVWHNTYVGTKMV